MNTEITHIFHLLKSQACIYIGLTSFCPNRKFLKAKWKRICFYLNPSHAHIYLREWHFLKALKILILHRFKYWFIFRLWELGMELPLRIITTGAMNGEVVTPKQVLAILCVKMAMVTMKYYEPFYRWN